MTEEIVNKVAGSGLINFNLEEYYPKGDRVLFDLKPFLYEELILKEKDYREALRNYNWQNLQGKYVAICCTADAIVPTWAFMLAASYIQPYAKFVAFGNLEALETAIYTEVLNNIDLTQFQDQRVVIKGCSDLPVPPAAYVIATSLLRKVAKSIMYGEPCSTVPVFKR